MFDGLDVVELHGNVHVHTTLTQGLINRLADAEAPVKRGEFLPLEIVVRNHLLPCQYVGSMTYKNHRLEMPWHNRQGPMRRRKRKDAEIGLVVDHGLDHFMRVQI